MKLTPEQQQLVEEHWEYVQKLVRQFAANRSMRDEDLHGPASVGLCEAAIAYDPRAGAKFTTFLRFRVIGAVQDHLRIERKQGFGCVGRGKGNLGVRSLDKHLRPNQHVKSNYESPLLIGDLVADDMPPPDYQLEYEDEARKVSRLGGMTGRSRIAVYALLTDPECPTMERAGRRAGLNESRVSQAVNQLRRTLLTHTEYGEQARRICDRRPLVHTRTIGYSRGKSRSA